MAYRQDRGRVDSSVTELAQRSSFHFFILFFFGSADPSKMGAAHFFFILFTLIQFIQQ